MPNELRFADSSRRKGETKSARQIERDRELDRIFIIASVVRVGRGCARFRFAVKSGKSKTRSNKDKFSGAISSAPLAAHSQLVRPIIAHDGGP